MQRPEWTPLKMKWQHPKGMQTHCFFPASSQEYIKKYNCKIEKVDNNAGEKMHHFLEIELGS